jgi:acetyltransferase-like isoleucine patch superfamily enzyme
VSEASQAAARDERGRDLRGTSRKAVGFVRAQAVFRAHGVSVGRLPQVHGRLVLRSAGVLRVGDHFVVDGVPLPTKFSVGPEGLLEIGDRAFINYGVDVNANVRIEIGDNVRIGPLVSIVDDDMHELTPGQRRRAPIHIGHNVWIGRGAVINPGVAIGDHAVLGAESVVTRDVAPATVAAGSPATMVKQLDVPASWRRT